MGSDVILWTATVFPSKDPVESPVLPYFTDTISFIIIFVLSNRIDESSDVATMTIANELGRSGTVHNAEH